MLEPLIEKVIKPLSNTQTYIIICLIIMAYFMYIMESNHISTIEDNVISLDKRTTVIENDISNIKEDVSDIKDDITFIKRHLLGEKK